MANIITAPESGIYFDGNTAGVADIPTLTGNASGVAIQYDGYAGIQINSSATGDSYLDRFSVEGANGRLFGVSDAVTGTVFSVNDAAGLPIIEVESTADYDKITIGEYGTDALVISGSSVEIGGETAATRDWVTGQGYVTASSEQQTLDNVLEKGNTSTRSMSVGAVTTDQINMRDAGDFITLYGNDDGYHAIGARSYTGGADDDIRINSYGSVYINLDSNNNNTSTADFRIGRHGGQIQNGTISDWLFTVDGENGNVGIGTTSPSQKLHVGSGHLQLDDTYKIQWGGTNARIDGSNASDYLRFWTSDTERMRLLTGGQLIVGGTAYGYSGTDLQVGNTSDSQNGLNIITSTTGYGYLLFGDGLANADSYVGQISYKHGDDYMAFQTASSERMRIDSSGNVGIGTASPNHKLDIYSNENVPLRIHRPSNANLDSSGAWGIGFSTRSDAATSTTDTRAGIFSFYNGNLFLATNTTSIVSDPDAYARLTVTNAGYVGIGTIDPDKQLHVRGSAPFIRIEEDSASNKRLDLWVDPSTAIAYVGANQSAQQLSFQTGNTDRIRILNNGNVGIGTTSPDRPLTINSDTAHRAIRILENDSANESWDIGVSVAGDLNFFNSADTNPTVVFSDGGNVGIGTTSPASELHVKGGIGAYTSDYAAGTTGSRLLMKPFATTGNTYSFIQAQDVGGTSNNALALQPYGDNVGIGTTSPEVKLHVGTSTLGTSPDTNADIISSGGITIDDNRRLSFDTNFYVHGNIKYNTSGTSEALLEYQGYYGHHFTRRSGTSAMVIKGDDGNVGIGTASPAQKLTVNAGHILLSNNYDFRGTDTGGNQRTLVRINSSNEAEYGSSLNGPIKFMGGGSYTERMRIHTNGNIGIGTTNPVGLLTISASGGTGLEIQAQDSLARMALVSYDRADSAYREIYFEGYNFNFNTSGTNTRLSILNNGNIGIGTTSPATKLHVGDGSADDVLRVNYNSSTEYLDIHGYGIVFDRGYSYLNPAADNSRTLSIGTASARWGTLDIYGSTTNLYGNFSVSGNLTVNGTTTTINSTTISVDDKNIELGSVATPTDTTADGGGITLKGATDKTINWLNTSSAWTFSDRIAIPYGNESAPSLTFSSDTDTGIYGASTFVRIVVGGVWKASIASNGITSNGFVKEGGTSSQFLKADGSVDSSSYITASSTDTLTNKTWNGNVIASAYLDADTAHLSGTQTFSGAKTFSAAATFNSDVTVSSNIYHAGDTDTRINFNTNSIKIEANSESQLVIDAAGIVVNELGSDNDFRIEGSGEANALFVQGSNGFVGIGTNSPSSKLEVNGTLEISPTEPTINLNRSNGSYSWKIVNGAGGGNFPLSTFNIANNAGTPVITALDGGNVGIGTTSPAKTLDVSANGSSQGIYLNISDVGRLHMYADGNRNYFAGVSGNGHRFTTTGGANVEILNNGNVGIGQTAPSEKLEVIGNIKQKQGSGYSNYVLSSVSEAQLTLATYTINQSTNPSAIIFSPNLTEAMRIDNSGNVGIGTTTPQKTLDVHLGNDSAVASIAGTISVGEYAGLHFGYSEKGNSYYRKSAIVFERTDLTAPNAQGKVHILNGPQSGSSSATLADAKLTIDEVGNVGIGTTSPDYELHVIGTASFTDTVAGAYFEENASHPSLKKLDTGTILVMNEEGQLVPCSKADDTMVFGVSKHGYKQPIVMGAEPIKVTGPIKVGDYITTSDTPGHGKKSNQPYPFGTIIAQAMESGDGESYNIKAMIRKM